MTATIYRSLFLWVMFSLVSCVSPQVELARDGVSNHEIVIPENADSTVQRAATELRRYLKLISAADIPVKSKRSRDPERHGIFVGNGRNLPVAFNNQAVSQYTIGYHVVDNDLYIYGGSSKSTLYAVYRFLEKELGCLWLDPGTEKIPTSGRITLSAATSYSYTPRIETRTVHSRLFYENPAFADKLGVTHEAFPGYVPGAGVHTFHRFIPESAFYRAHPEYYALRNGKRLTTQLCLSNEEVLHIVTDSVRACFERFPDAAVISVSQNDNTLYCQCGQCAAIDAEEGSPSGSLIRFVNSVAAHFPDKKISTLAYQYTRKPPVTRPASNVLVTLCSIECDRSKPIEEGCTGFANDLKGWKKLTDNIRIWDYTTQFTNFLAPFPNFHTLKPNIAFFRDNHARWVFEQHSYHPSELFELRSYLTAQLLWNPDRDDQEIMREFCTAYYQEAAPFIMEYIHTIHDEIRKVPEFFLFLYGDPSQGFDSFLRPELLDKYDRLYQNAGEAVKYKPDVLERVSRASLSIHYAILEASRKGISEKYRLSAEIHERLAIFEDICASGNITLMNEMGFSVEEYIASYKQALKRAAMPDLAAGKPVQLLTQPNKYAGEDPQTLTDGSLGGNSFYAGWLGFEGNDMIAIIDLEQITTISHLETAFLKVTNHIVFFPEQVIISTSADNETYHEIADRKSEHPLHQGDKINDIEYYSFHFSPVKARYVKIEARSMKKAPPWHHASGLPVWTFCDEVIIY